ncbi:MAG: DUF4921 family protein [Planctomycetota bacterium]
MNEHLSASSVDSPDTRMVFTEETRVILERPESRGEGPDDDYAQALQELLGVRVAVTSPETLHGEHIPGAPAAQQRLDPITGETTLFSAVRMARPNVLDCAVADEGAESDPRDCPFCVGNENQTPRSVWEASLPREELLHSVQELNEEQRERVLSSTWSVRVVPNLFPAVASPASSTLDGVPRDTETRVNENRAVLATKHAGIGRMGTLHLESTAASSNRRTVMSPSHGGHEVIIESARHVRSFSELTPGEISLVFAAYASRLRYWRRQPGIRSLSVFKNVGRDGGASLPHTHSQLIASNQPLGGTQRMEANLASYYEQTGRPLVLDLLHDELRAGERVIARSDQLVAVCPYASRFASMVRLSSTEQCSAFEDLPIATIERVARLTRRAVLWLEQIYPSLAYNVVLNTRQPNSDLPDDAQQWFIDIIPRISRLAGFELATHATINPVFPELAAARLRQQARRSDPRTAWYYKRSHSL